MVYTFTLKKKNITKVVMDGGDRKPLRVSAHLTVVLALEI